MDTSSLYDCSSFKKLIGLAESSKKVHLRELLKDEARNGKLHAEFDGAILDCSRQKISLDVLAALYELAEERAVCKKRDSMFAGEHVNFTEKRAVMHMALRSCATESFSVGGKNIVAEVHEVLGRIKSFSNDIRTGGRLGHTGMKLTSVVCIGIGGSYLGSEFVLEALRTDSQAAAAAQGRTLRFLANVDPIDMKRALEGLKPETTLVVVISKTFTTAETMLNARTVRDWLLKGLGDEAAIGKHVAAISTNIEATSKFGINPENVFGFWDWVGGRFSVTSAVGILPLALQYGFDIVGQFLAGCRSMDNHFKSAPIHQNLPITLALCSVWNSTFLGHGDVAVLPYCQALHRFPAHIQQLAMESNGKSVGLDGSKLKIEAGELYFGEPGTNGQHSFYQLLHQGRVVPAEFIGFVKSQNPIHVEDEPVSNHDELMSNFFAQPDALALGKTCEEVAAQGVPKDLICHKVFSGDRPSSVLMMPSCNAYYCGMLLSLYEHRTAVQGFLWGINSFDQWGVELGKVLATNVRKCFGAARCGDAECAKNVSASLPSPTRRLIDHYLKNSS